MVMTKNSFNNSVSGLIQPYSTRTQMRLMSCTWLFSYFSTFLFTAMANTNLYKRVNPSGQLFSNDTSCPFPISTASCTFTISGAIRPATTLTKSTGWLYGSRGAMQVRRFRILSLSLASEVMCDGFSLSWLVTRPVTKGGEVPLEKFSPPPLEKCVGYSLKLLNKVQKIWAPLRKLFALVSQAGYGPARHLPLSIVIEHVRDILNDPAAGFRTACPSFNGFGLRGYAYDFIWANSVTHEGCLYPDVRL